MTEQTAPEYDEPHVCKAGATIYFCPTAGEVESDCHGGFDVCCARPDLHIAVDDLVKTMAPMLEGLQRLLATSCRDWGDYRVDAWLWAVLCGWDCEQETHDETCVHGAMEEMQRLHGWDDAAVAKARRYRAAVRAIEALNGDVG